MSDDLLKPNQELRIGLLKFGKSTYFDPSGWKAIGADIEVRMLIQVLCPLVKEVHFWGAYNLGPKDAAKFTLPSNLVLHDRKLFIGRDYDSLVSDVEATNVDVFIVVNGPHSVNNRGVQMFERYVYPNLQILNRTSTPWIYLYSDPRYWIKAKELSRPPQKILAQYPLKKQLKRLQGSKVPMDYDRLDVWGFWRFNTPKVEYSIDNRENVFRLIGNSKPGYWKLWNEVYRPALDDAGIPWEIWGIWPEAPKEDQRYKQTSIKQGWDILTKTKHLFILVTGSALDNGYPITGRWWELAMSDALVWINDKYDHRGQLISLNHFTRVKSGVELVERLQELERDPDKYKRLVQEQRSRFSSEQEKPEFLGKQLLASVQDVLKNPVQEAWPSSMMNPQVSPSYEMIDLELEKVSNKALTLPTDKKLILNCGFRPYALIKKAIEINQDHSVTFQEACGMFDRDPYFQHVGKNYDLKRNVAKIAVHCFSVLQSRGCLLQDVTDEQLNRSFPYEEVSQSMPEYVPIDRSRRSAGAKRAGTLQDQQRKEKKMLGAKDQKLKAEWEHLGIKGEILGEVISGDKKILYVQEELPLEFLGENGDEAEIKNVKRTPRKKIPIANRVLVATIDHNPFRVNSATRVHFQQVLDAGSKGITYDDLARKIVETNTQGVQTGERLAGWSFSIFPAKRYAKVMTHDAEGNLVDYSKRTRQKRQDKAVEAESEIEDETQEEEA